MASFSVPAAGVLESAGELNLYRTVGAKLVVLESTYVCVGGQRSTWHFTYQVKRSGRFSSIQACEGGDSHALMDGAAKGKERSGQHFFPVGRMLMAQNTQHGVKVGVSPFHGVRLGIIGRHECKSDAGQLESLLHRLGPEVGGVVGVNLQGITKSCIKCLKSPQYLLDGGVAEGYGFEPLAEDVLQREQVPVAF